MLFRRFYYQVKPYVPRRLRLGIRRFFAARKLSQFAHSWPVNPAAGIPPTQWPGWPDGKRFGVVLTHDVEGQVGFDRSLQLMETEQKLGFRSSFNFIPEGEYTVRKPVRDELAANGFEVGVHDLKHDGKLFRSESEFRKSARRINHYLEDWGAVGFRAGFMLRNLDWIHQLNIEYDASTFDTDPFEPQPDGAGTIFPFWIPRPSTLNHQPSTISKRSEDRAVAPREGGNDQPSTLNGSSSHRNGYTELPYTLPQDSTLFLILKETTPSIWLKKLDWIVANRGMVLLITHPDYISFDASRATAMDFPIEHYQALLRCISERYSSEFWHGLPRDLVRHLRNPQAAPRLSKAGDLSKHTLFNLLVWVVTDACNLSEYCALAA